MIWSHLGRIIAPGRHRRAAEKLRLAMAYRNLFGGAGNVTDAQVVVADLAAAARFFDATAPAVSDRERAFQEGRRDVFARIFHFMNFSDAHLSALAEAAALEQRNTDEIGPL